jgi:hypothetical protein
VSLRLILVSLLLLPGVALGPGWCLRVCLVDLLGGGACCAEEPASAACCSDAAPAAEHGTCDACCLDIDSSPERVVPAPDPLHRELRGVALATWTACLLAPAPPAPAPAPRSWSRPPPSPAGPLAPLPLRI